MKARRDSLEEVHSAPQLHDGNRKAAVHGGRARQGARSEAGGRAGGFLEVDPQYEKATEEFLHDELEYVVVRQLGGVQSAASS